MKFERCAFSLAHNGIAKKYRTTIWNISPNECSIIDWKKMREKKTEPIKSDYCMLIQNTIFSRIGNRNSYVSCITHYGLTAHTHTIFSQCVYTYFCCFTTFFSFSHFIESKRMSEILYEVRHMRVDWLLWES